MRDASSPLLLSSIGRDLARPECVLACASGRLYASDRRGGIAVIEPDGAQRRIGDAAALMPNGIALCRDGSFLVANMGADGGVWRIDRDGQAWPWLTEVDGVPLPKVNFVAVDARDRAWVCVSSRDTGDAYPVHEPTGFIALVEGEGEGEGEGRRARIVADGLRYTNECRIDASGRRLYVNETFGRCTSCFALRDDGELSDRTVVAEFTGDGDFPDGLALDAEGGLWVVCVGSNRVYRVAPGGEAEAVIDDAVPETARALEDAFGSASLTRPMLSSAVGQRLHNPTSLAFAGADLRTAVLGCLKGGSLATFRAPVAGLPPAHWHWG